MKEELKKLKGNPDHPVNRGGARSNLDASIQLHYNRDRLHAQKIRRSKDGIQSNTSFSEMDKFVKEATSKGKKIVVVSNPTRSTEDGFQKNLQAEETLLLKHWIKQIYITH